MTNTHSAAEVFLALRERCMWLDACNTTFQVLYESGDERKDVMGRTAPAFFMQHNQVLQQHCILQACKLTDPAEMRGGKKNLTFDYLNSMLRAAALMTDEIEMLTNEMASYRKLVLESRHWIISHHDLDATMRGEPVGAHEKGDWLAFLDNMCRYTDAVGIALGVGPLDYRAGTGPGDAEDLIRHLRNSLNRR